VSSEIGRHGLKKLVDGGRGAADLAAVALAIAWLVHFGVAVPLGATAISDPFLGELPQAS
jgi:hypothetical protein